MQKSRIGLSSACFYPEETLDSVKRCAELGFTNVEIFMNSFSELEKPYLRRVRAFCEESGTTVTSIHPFTSGYEYMLFFSAYKKRAGEAAEFYRKYFHAAAYLGAEFVVFHGDAVRAPFFGMDNYCEVLSRLMETAKSEGAVLAHENVSTARAGDPVFMKELHERFGQGNISFVFDLKQTLRGGYDPFAMLDAMRGDIRHIHINDWKDGECRLPYSGEVDVDKVISHIESDGYSGKYIIEVYHHNFDSTDEITTSGNRLREIIP